MLSIQRQYLRVVPAPVSDLLDLTELDLRYNFLRNLTDLSKLQKLLVLKLTNNQLESLPGSLFELSELQLLWVDVNKLTSLPPEIGKLTHLAYLKVDENDLIDCLDYANASGARACTVLGGSSTDYGELIGDSASDTYKGIDKDGDVAHLECTCNYQLFDFI